MVVCLISSFQLVMYVFLLLDNSLGFSSDHPKPTTPVPISDEEGKSFFFSRK
jgi:hypothetical protein